MAKEVTIDRAMVQRMIGDQRFVNLLAPVRTLKKQGGTGAGKKKGCNKCGRKAKPAFTNSDVEAAVRGIAGIVTNDGSVRKQLKKLLETTTLRLSYTNVNGTGRIIRKV